MFGGDGFGDGRPATYASILSNITQRGYITLTSKRRVNATALGESIVDQLVGRFRFVDLDYTRDLEADLDRIVEGACPYHDVVAGMNTRLTAELAGLGPAPTAHPCPDCGKPMKRRTGPRGAFWGCSDYPTCTATLPDVDGAPGERVARPAAPAAPATGPTCPDCGKPLRRNIRAKQDDPKGRGWDFWGCSGYPTCRKSFASDASGAPILPSPTGRPAPDRAPVARPRRSTAASHTRAAR
jgi:DNA topoisomerase-1